MEQIIKHFTPAMAAFVVGILLISILVAILAADGTVAQEMSKLVTDFISGGRSYLPTVPTA